MPRVPLRFFVPALGSLLAVACPAMAQGGADQPYAPRVVTPRLPDYAVAADLSNVTRSTVLDVLTAPQREALVRNGFVAWPSTQAQAIDIYTNASAAGQPLFVTTDVVLNTYHVFSDYLLRYLETTKLLPAVGDMSRALAGGAQAAYNAEPPMSPAKAPLGRVLAYLTVPCYLTGRDVQVDRAVGSLARADLARVTAHAGRDRCGLDSFVDFTQFIPRGHYTRSPELSRYFQVVSWYGQVPMPLSPSGPLTEALLLIELLSGNKDASTQWAGIDDTLSFYIGDSDDLTARDLEPLVQQVFGEGPPARFCDRARQQQFVDLVNRSLPAPRVAQADPDGNVQGRLFRLMAQRFLPDARVLQETTSPKVGTPALPRYMPLGLDVFAALGSKHAVQLLDGVYRQTAYANYVTQRDMVTKELAAMSPATWSKNLTSAWLWSLKPLLEPAGAGYPMFMRSPAWQDKQLVCALGSWTELRHDTVLYAKQSYSGGYSGSPGGAEVPPGYVEPTVEVYDRLAWLLRRTFDGLRRRGALGPDAQYVGALVARFSALCDNLARISAKELAGTPLRVEELTAIKSIGTSLATIKADTVGLLDGFGGSNRRSAAGGVDNQMALVTDVHSSPDKVLQEAIGRPAVILVVAPFGNTLTAFSGATYTHFEFELPSAGRLTDERWQAQIAGGQTPPMAPWVASYLVPAAAAPAAGALPPP